MVGGDDEMMNSNNNSIPHLFKCPISLDLFRDPVTLCTGQTYDRSYIEKWLAAGNLTCPVTMQKLHDLSLVPNHTLQHLIHHWLCMDTRFNPHSYTTFDPKLSLAVLKHNIESHKIAFATRLEALAKIRILSEELEWRRTYLIQLGFFPILLRLLFTKLSLVEGMLAKQDSDIAEEALHCVLNLLPFSDMSCLNVLKQDLHLETFLVLLKQGSSEIKMKLCYLVGAIASCSKTRELCLMLGQSRCFLRGLMDLLHDNSQEVSEAANEAILAVCSFHSNRESFIKQDGVGSLLSYLSNKPRQASVSLAALELLLESNSGKQALLNNANGVHILVNMVFGVCFDHRGSESAVSSLLSLCYESVKVREEAICAGVLTQLLLLLQSQCSSKAKNKGRVLLKLLRSM